MHFATWQAHRNYLNLAFPLIISTLSAPLTGVVDTAIMGRLPDAVYIGGVSVAVLIFNTLYWLLGFLRVSTSGFSAQALGDSDRGAVTLALFRPLFLALLLGLAIILLQYPLKMAAFTVLAPAANLAAIASEYFDIRIWSAPFTLFNYVATGWLLGMGRVKFSLFLQVFLNLVNAALSYVLVLDFGLQAAGVAWASLFAEIATVALSFALFFKVRLVNWQDIDYRKIYAFAQLSNMLRMNRDLFIRTFCLLAVFNLFGIYGLRYGEEILAANAVLMQIHFVMVHILAGFGNANTVLVGRALGSKTPTLYFQTMQISFFWSALTAALLAILLFVFGREIIGFFTHLTTVRELAFTYSFWLLLFPFVSFGGLLLYGAFVGATNGVPIRNSLLLSLVLFLLCLFAAESSYQNHGLWFAFIMFSLGRTIFLWPYLAGQNKIFARFRSE